MPRTPKFPEWLIDDKTGQQTTMGTLRDLFADILLNQRPDITTEENYNDTEVTRLMEKVDFQAMLRRAVSIVTAPIHEKDSKEASLKNMIYSGLKKMGLNPNGNSINDVSVEVATRAAVREVVADLQEFKRNYQEAKASGYTSPG